MIWLKKIVDSNVKLFTSKKKYKCFVSHHLGSRPSPNPSTPKCDRFPTDDERANIVTCPTFYPTDDQFKDPLEYIQSIAPKAEVYGICKIVPPASWKVGFSFQIIQEFLFYEI